MNKIALITGGSSGFGFAMAERLQSQGYDLILIARDLAKLNQAKKNLQCNNSSTNISIFSCDISNETELDTTFKEIYVQFETVDILILNAGIATIELLEDYGSIKEISRDIKINLLGVISVTYLGLPLLKPGSHILFVSSGFGLIGPAGYSLYAAAKAGIVNFAEAMRRELIRKNIAVHVACPGDIDTPMLAAELQTMPEWIRGQAGRTKPQSAQKVAQNVLKQVFKNKFLIAPSLDVKFLVLIKKLLPSRLYTLMGDQILPLPPNPR